MERIFVLEEQPAWSTHRRSKARLRVHPKWHFIDPSLATAALHASPDALLNDLNTVGFLFESLAVCDLRIYADALRGRVSHYRDSNGLEVDAIVELRDERWAAFEVKIGGAKNLDVAASNLLALQRKVSEKRETAPKPRHPHCRRDELHPPGRRPRGRPRAPLALRHGPRAQPDFISEAPFTTAADDCTYGRSDQTLPGDLCAALQHRDHRPDRHPGGDPGRPAAQLASDVLSCVTGGSLKILPVATAPKELHSDVLTRTRWRS